MDFVVKEAKEKNVKSDLGLKNEMSYAIANLIEIEEHLSATIGETENKNLLPVMDEMRKMRAKYMRHYIGDKNIPGQLWCVEKHILSTAFRLSEVATKNIALNNNDKAVENLKDSNELYKMSLLILDLVEEKNGNDG